jgi:imidazolonepropionase-like amidohydrolase
MATVIRNVKILLGQNFELTENHEVWMKDNKIISLNPQTNKPADDCIDGEGGYLIPGLIDLHVHMMWDGSINPVQTTESEGYEQMLIRSVENMKHYLNNGITTVRDVGSIDDISLHVAKAIRRGLINGPEVIACGKTLTMTGGHDPFWARFVDGKDEALRGVREQIYKGAKVIKVSATGGVYGRSEGEDASHSELRLEELTVICKEAHRFGLKVASHAIGREGILNSILAGVDTIEHGHYMDEELLTLMEQHKVAWHPTLYVYRQVAKQKGVPEYAQKKAVEIVKIHNEAFKNFYHRNILIGAGSDAGSPGVSHHALRDELYAMNETMQNNALALKTATINAGKILGKKVGCIKEGFEADFMILNKDPLSDLKYIEDIKHVIAKGKLIK